MDILSGCHRWCRKGRLRCRTAGGSTISLTLWRSAMRADQGEHRALRVLALDNPHSARHVMRSLKHLSALAPHPVGCCVDCVDGEVVEPERRGDGLELGHN